jgi:hypothetical protein
MITIFSRKEVYHGFSMQDCYKVRELLAANHIKYQVKTVDSFRSSGRSASRGAGINMDYAYEYYIYVHKKDYDQAGYVLNQR